MPKTGSQTVEATLRAAGSLHQILRLHYLSAQMEAEIVRGPAGNISPGAWDQVAAGLQKTMSRVRSILRVRRLLRRIGVPIPKMEVISAVREPIGAALSSIFENYSFFFPDLDSITSAGCSEIVQRPRMMQSYQTWLDVETKSVLDIDVYQSPFPREQGYAIYENYFSRLLLYRFEALDRLPAMLNDFLHCSVDKIVDANLGSSKPYAAAYARIKKNLQLPSKFVTREYSSKMMMHFYSPVELAQLSSRWGANLCVPLKSCSPRPAELSQARS